MGIPRYFYVGLLVITLEIIMIANLLVIDYYGGRQGTQPIQKAATRLCF